MCEFICFSELHADKNHNKSVSTKGGFTTWMEHTSDVLDQIFNYAEENNIVHVFHGGDLFEKKNYLPQDLYNFIWDKFFFYSRDINIFLNTGNHDFHSAVSSSLRPFSDIVTVVTEPENFPINGGNVRVIPYGMVDGNINSPKYFGDSEYNVLFTHEDIAGLTMGPNDYVSGSKYKKQIFGDWDYVFNGHIHKAQRVGNIINMGSVMRHNFGETDKKYFYHYKDGDIKQIEIDCPKFIVVEGFSNKVRDVAEKDDTNFYRIDVSPEELNDSLFKKYNVFPNVVKIKKKKKRLQSDMTEEEELSKYIEIVESNLDKNKLLEMVKEL